VPLLSRHRFVAVLKQRAARHVRSAEAEHRALLEDILLYPKAKSFAEVLVSMPDVGRDEDFFKTGIRVLNPFVLTGE